MAITNIAQLNYNGVVTNSNETSGNYANTVNVTKYAVESNYSKGDDITYVVSVANSNTTPLTEVSIVDNLGTYTVTQGVNVTPLTYVTNSAQIYVNGILLNPAPTITPTANSLTIGEITIPPFGSATFVYQGLVNQYAPLSTGSAITNQVTVSAKELANSIVETDVVNVQNAPSLLINKTLTPPLLLPGQPITYTFTIQNNGNTATQLTDTVQVNDVFDPPLNNIVVTLNGSVINPPAYSYDVDSGVFIADIGIVPAATTQQTTSTGIVTLSPGTSVLTVTGTTA